MSSRSPVSLIDGWLRLSARREPAKADRPSRRRRHASCKSRGRAATQLATIPDLFNYWLTGELRSEYTIATTTQMIDARMRTWAFDLLRELDIPTRLLPPIVEPVSETDAAESRQGYATLLRLIDVIPRMICVTGRDGFSRNTSRTTVTAAGTGAMWTRSQAAATWLTSSPAWTRSA